MPSEWRMCDACEPQQSATSVHANATRPLLRARSSSFLAAISLHLRALSPAPAAAPPLRAVDGNPHSVSLAASSSPAPGGVGALSRTAADSARRLTAAVSTRASAARMPRTRAAQPPHIMPLTSSSTAEPAPMPAPSSVAAAAEAASTALEADDDGSAVARVLGRARGGGGGAGSGRLAPRGGGGGTELAGDAVGGAAAHRPTPPEAARAGGSRWPR
nr:unnamed protein product [Digitaria exilis]